MNLVAADLIGLRGESLESFVLYLGEHDLFRFVHDPVVTTGRGRLSASIVLRLRKVESILSPIPAEQEPQSRRMTQHKAKRTSYMHFPN